MRAHTLSLIGWHDIYKLMYTQCKCLYRHTDYDTFSITFSVATILQCYGVKKPVCYIRDNEVITFLCFAMILES